MDEIKTLTRFNTLIKALDKRFPINALIEVIDLRIRRIENHLGMTMPDDIERVRITEGRKKS